MPHSGYDINIRKGVAEMRGYCKDTFNRLNKHQSKRGGVGKEDVELIAGILSDL